MTKSVRGRITFIEAFYRGITGNDREKLIHDWQEKLKASFGDESRLHHYLFETLENFFYRYLETTQDKNLKVTELAPHTFGAVSFENNMVEALKTKGAAKPGIMELAKSVPKAQNPQVRYGLWIEANQVSADKGKLLITAEINWGFPDFKDQNKRLQKNVKFEWIELAQFRKELALKLEEAASLFLD